MTKETTVVNFKLVESYEKYRSLIQGKKPINSGFWPDEINRYINDRRLAYTEVDNILFLLYDEKKYRQLVVAGTLDIENFSGISFPNNIPIICQVVENREKDNNKLLKLFLENINFRCRCKIGEYEFNDIGQVDFDKQKGTINVRHHADNQEEYNHILELWQESLPVIEIPYISLYDLKKMDDDGHLIILDDPNSGQIAGACCFDIYLGVSTIHHIVVNASYRKCGYSTIILKEWLMELKRLGARKARSWIEENNIASIKSFEKIGFSITSNLSYQYILQ